MTPMPFEQYRSEADADAPRIASLIAEQLRPLWWSEAAFDDSREAHRHTITSSQGPFKVEAARLLEAPQPAFGDGDVEARELGLLSEAKIDGIITTNYDSLMETAFPDYRVFVGQDELLMSDPQEVGGVLTSPWKLCGPRVACDYARGLRSLPR